MQKTKRRSDIAAIFTCLLLIISLICYTWMMRTPSFLSLKAGKPFLNWIMQYQIVWDQKQNTPEEATVTQEYLNELEADVLAIDSLIAFAGSEKGEQVFGADQAKHIIINFILLYYIVNNNITDTLNEKHGLSYLFYFFIIVWFITLYMCVRCIQRDFYIV